MTFTVGGLSAINAVAGAFAENLPVICITGVSITINSQHPMSKAVCSIQRPSSSTSSFIALSLMQVPNSNDFGDPTKVLHHTTAEENFNQEHRCFQEVTCCQVLILLLSHIHRVHYVLCTQGLHRDNLAYPATPTTTAIVFSSSVLFSHNIPTLSS